MQLCIMFLTDIWKKLRIYLWNSSIYTFLWVLAPSWQHVSCCSLCHPSPVELVLIDRSEPRFKSHTGATITKTLKNNGDFNGFYKFSPISDSKLFRPDQENERRDIQLSTKRKKTSAKHLQTMLDLKCTPSLWFD